jgi:hypothetical protein
LWLRIFAGDVIVTSALLDRLLHRAQPAFEQMVARQEDILRRIRVLGHPGEQYKGVVGKLREAALTITVCAMVFAVGLGWMLLLVGSSLRARRHGPRCTFRRTFGPFQNRSGMSFLSGRMQRFGKPGWVIVQPDTADQVAQAGSDLAKDFNAITRASAPSATTASSARDWRSRWPTGVVA